MHPNSGSDTTSIETFAQRIGDSYVVNGQKIWTSRALHSDLMVLLARTTPPDKVEKRTGGLSVLLVDMNQARNAGMKIEPVATMMNHSTTQIFFENVQVPVENRIGEEGEQAVERDTRERGRRDCEVVFPEICDSFPIAARNQDRDA